MVKGIVLVQGINDKEYMLDELKAANFPFSNYDFIEFVNTETDFDLAYPLKKWPWLDKLGDKFGDIWQFYTQTEKRKEVCRKVRATILKLRGLCNEVDVIAHSLGTVITLTCASKDEVVMVDKFYCVASPLSFSNWVLGVMVRAHTKKYSYGLVVRGGVRYYWSAMDLVCQYYNNSVSKVLKAVLPVQLQEQYTVAINNHECMSNHSLSKYVPAIVYTYP